MPVPHLPVHSPQLRLPPLLFSARSPSPSSKPYSSLFFLQSPRTPNPPLSSLLPLRALPISDADLLDAFVGSSGDEPKPHLPAVRSYQNDLARLTLIGSVASDQALTAAAADGGDAADEHLATGAATMVVETVFPGGFDERSTVSTRLFLPAKKVKEKAKKLRGSMTADALAGLGAGPKNILAMTFRQVVLQRLWSFELALFCPGTERDMEELANPKEAPIDFSVSTADEKFLSALAEVVCSYALEKTKMDCDVDWSGRNSLLDWLSNPKMIRSVDSSVFLYQISPEAVLGNARKQMEKFNLTKDKPLFLKRKLKHSWWSPPNFGKFCKDAGPAFTDWINEHAPAYLIQVEGNKFKGAKFDGWKKLADNRWEVSLTHFQMVELASILDLYYDDQYTLPNKVLSSGLISEISNFSRNKSSFWKTFLLMLAGGCFVMIISILGQLYFPCVLKAGKSSKQNSLIPSAITGSCQILSLEASELEYLCISVVGKIKDALSWPGDIMFDKNIGAWTGTLPNYLKDCKAISCNQDSETNMPLKDASDPSDMSSSHSSPSETSIQTTAQDTSSYQVVLSRDGDIVGFQPTNRVAVNHWATNPLAKILYKQQKLSPGILEPSIKIPRPQEVVLIELLMSANPQLSFALARPV